MGLFGIGRNNNEPLPEKEKIIQLLSEITTILESDDTPEDVNAEEKVYSQAEYDAMQQSLNTENEKLKTEIEQLKSELATTQSVEAASTTEIDQTEEQVAEEGKSVVVQLKAIDDRVSELVRKETVIQELHSELQKYKSGLKKDIIAPILKSIIRCYDRVTEYKRVALSATDESAEAILQQVGKEYDNLSLYISDMLYDYDIEVVDVSVGDSYEPKRHKAITTIETDDDSKHNTIAEVKKIGFEDVVLCRVLRHCEVVVYKLKEK